MSSVRDLLQQLSRPSIPQYGYNIIVNVRGLAVIEKEIALTVIKTKLCIICFKAIIALNKITAPMVLTNDVFEKINLSKNPSPGTRCVAVETNIRAGAVEFSLRNAAVPANGRVFWLALFSFSMMSDRWR